MLRQATPIYYVLPMLNMQLANYSAIDPIHNIEVISYQTHPVIEEDVAIRTQAQNVTPDVATSVRPSQCMYVRPLAIARTVHTHLDWHLTHLTYILIQGFYGTGFPSIADTPLSTDVPRIRKLSGVNFT